MTTKTTRQWMTAKVGQCVTTCAACGDVIVINPGEEKYCEQHAVVDLDSAARRLGAYIRAHAVPLAGRAQA